MNRQKIIFIIGPTAVGKTDVALLLAKKLKTEIISCDAMQVYKEISILTNKPSSEILKTVPHHLINCVSVAKDFDVALFRNQALKSIKKIRQKGKIPVIAGGSGLYISALLDGLFDGVKKNGRIRRQLEKEAEEKGNDYLYKRLQSVDPQAAFKIHPNNVRRIIRALEVFLVSREPISKLQKNREGLWGQYDIRIFCLNRKREELYRLIDRRVDTMFQGGAVEEIRKLMKKKWGQTARHVIGVREIQDVFSNQHDIERAKYLIKLKSRRYAKRQLTWFRRDHRLQWIQVDSKDKPKDIVSYILKEINSHV